jgi:hypothetical protein
MGFVKSLLGLEGVEKVGDRILGELEAARARGEQQLLISYTQSEIGVRANATQMALLIRRRFEKRGFEVLDGEGGAFGDDVRMLVRCQPAPSAAAASRTTAASQSSDPDLERLHRAMKAIDEAPPGGKEGASMTGPDIEATGAWVADRFAAGDYEAVWHRRLELGLGLSGDKVDTETWFWLNAYSALAALRLGAKDHPLVSTAAGFADQAYRQLSIPNDQVREAMAEINERFFG